MASITANAEHTWGSYHWARTTPSFQLYVTASVTPSWSNELADTLTKWTVDGLLSFKIGAIDDSELVRRRCSMIAGEIRVCNDSYGSNGWLGLATIGIDSSGHVDMGTAKLNDYYSSYWQIVGMKNHVMCQEVGHLFGLGHTSENGSSQSTCMDYSKDIDSQWPNEHDYAQLIDIYAHLDSYSSYTGAPVPEPDSGGGKKCNSPSSKGCNKGGFEAEIPPLGVRVNENRNEEVWVAPRADGGLWVHHIRLVPENQDDLDDH